MHDLRSLFNHKRLRSNGGPGQAGVAAIRGHILTVAESLEKAIALSAVESVELRTDRRIVEIPMIEFLGEVEQRTRHSQDAGLSGRVFAEIGRLRNVAEASHGRAR